MTMSLLKKLYLVFGYETDILLSSEIPEFSVDIKLRALSVFQPIFIFDRYCKNKGLFELPAV